MFKHVIFISDIFGHFYPDSDISIRFGHLNPDSPGPARTRSDTTGHEIYYKKFDFKKNDT